MVLYQIWLNWQWFQVFRFWFRFQIQCCAKSQESQPNFFFFFFLPGPITEDQNSNQCVIYYFTVSTCVIWLKYVSTSTLTTNILMLFFLAYMHIVLFIFEINIFSCHLWENKFLFVKQNKPYDCSKKPKRFFSLQSFIKMESFHLKSIGVWEEGKVTEFNQD